ncbi:MAG: hypothetical protein BWY82_00046 [Verrucomicrobia bacterium ADurb.Bin474]|nr:MAG: hypothetical protein BWY82_00046 [Verrucomicrobia bacterium ADurb.Bin474]
MEQTGGLYVETPTPLFFCAVHPSFPNKAIRPSQGAFELLGCGAQGERRPPRANSGANLRVDGAGELADQFDLVFFPDSFLVVDHAERSQNESVRSHDRIAHVADHSCVNDHVPFLQKRGCARVADHELGSLFHHILADRIAGGCASLNCEFAFQSERRFEELPAVADNREQANRGVQKPCGESGKPVKYLLWRCIHQAGFFQGMESLRTVQLAMGSGVVDPDELSVPVVETGLSAHAGNGFESRAMVAMRYAAGFPERRTQYDIVQIRHRLT